MKEKFYIKETDMPASIEAFNALAGWINKNAPTIQDLLTGCSLGKSTERPPKGVADKLSNICQTISELCPEHPTRCRAFMDYRKYSVYLDTVFTVLNSSGTGCRYIKKSVCLARDMPYKKTDWQPVKLVSEISIAQLKRNYETTRAKIEKLESKLYAITQTLEPFER